MKRKPRPAKAGKVVVQVGDEKVMEFIVDGVVGKAPPLAARRLAHKILEGVEYLLERE
jgi:hypothetical protein